MNRKTVLALALALMLTIGLVSGVAAESALSAELYSFEAVIDGAHYAFPCPIDQLTQNGWVLKEDPEEKLKTNQYAIIYFDKEGYAQMMAYAYNPYSSARAIGMCYIGGFELTINSYNKLPTASCEMPGGIVLDQSKLDDVLNAYGEPSSRYDSDTRVSVTYRYDGWREVTFTSDNESGAGHLTGIKLQNLTEPAGFVDEVGDTDTPPAVALMYIPPTQLGDNPLAHTIELAGALYQIPAPVSEFLDNGFTILEDKSEAVVPGSDSGWVTLMKDNQQLRTLAVNYSEDATNIRNCFVTEVKVGNDLLLAAKLPLGIEMGMSHANLTAILEGLEYKTDESASFLYYMMADNERATNAVTVQINKETDAVTGITVENDVRRADIERNLANAPAQILLGKPLKVEFTPASPPATADQLSPELSDFQALINGRLYTFPLDYPTLAGDGWVVSDDDEQMISPSTYELFQYKFGSPMSEKTVMTIFIVNDTEEEAPANQLKIGGFKASTRDNKHEPAVEFVLAKGIRLGASTFDDVLAAYGEPGYQNEQRSLEYSFGSYKSIDFRFEEGVLTEINLRNFLD